MKTKLPLRKLTLTLTGMAALSVAVLSAKADSNQGGTDILHFSVKSAMTLPAQPSLPEANGSVALMYKGQGHVVVQDLGITVKKLAPNTAYTLAKLEPQVVEPPLGSPPGTQSQEILVPVLPALDTFTSDAKGNAASRYRKIVHENGQDPNPGKGKRSLPAGLDLLEEVVLGVLDANGTIILVADLRAPDKFSYLVKRNLSTDTLRATLRISASPSSAQLSLVVAPLEASVEYTLALNHLAAAGFTSDAKGRLMVRYVLDNPRDILKLDNVSLLDTRPTLLVPPVDPIVVLSTDLPLPDK